MKARRLTWGALAVVVGFNGSADDVDWDVLALETNKAGNLVEADEGGSLGGVSAVQERVTALWCTDGALSGLLSLGWLSGSDDGGGGGECEESCELHLD